jgi:hypothetical protein
MRIITYSDVIPTIEPWGANARLSLVTCGIYCNIAKTLLQILKYNDCDSDTKHPIDHYTGKPSTLLPVGSGVDDVYIFQLVVSLKYTYSQEIC